MSVQLVVQAEEETLLAVLDGESEGEERSISFRDQQGRSLGLYPALAFREGRLSPWAEDGALNLLRLEGSEQVTVKVDASDLFV